MKIITTYILLLLVQIVAYAQTPQLYDWQNITMNGGGYVDGFSFSKAKKGLLYARTDMGGAYRWEEKTKKWTPITDKFVSWNDMGILSIAADPKDSNKVYMAVGNPWGAFYRSTDKGESWTKSTFPITSMQLWGNGIGRATGERLQIDPNQTNILFLGTSRDGLLKSTDQGATWSVVNTFPKKKTLFVAIDATTGNSKLASQTIYIGTSDHYDETDTTASGLEVSGDTSVGGIYVSRDAGATWKLLENQPTKIEPKTWFQAKNKISTPAVPYQAAFGGNYIYFTFGEHDKIPNCNPNNSGSCNNGGLYRYDKVKKTWKELLPDAHNAQGAYCAVAVHPTKSNVILVGTLGQYYPKFDQLFASIDTGATWTRLFATATFLPSNSPFAGPSPNWLSGIQINPFDGNHFVYGSGKGAYMGFDLEKVLAKQPISFGYASDGIEQTYVAGLFSPTKGANLLSSLGDIMGFRHADFNQSPPMSFVPSHGNGGKIDYASQFPDTIVRTHGGGNNGASVSFDQGLTWRKFELPEAGIATPPSWAGLAISADAKRIVWSYANDKMAYSTDFGMTWKPSTFPTAGAIVELISDKVKSNLFYYPRINEGKLYRSTDGGINFTATAGVFGTSTGTYDTDVTSVYNRSGHVWIAINGKGLYYTTNEGATFVKVANVSSARRVAVGKSKTASAYPSVFIDGVINNVRSLYRSDDMGLTWTEIRGDKWFGNNIVCVGADTRVYGRMYIGTNGRGILYGDIKPSVVTEIVEFEETTSENQTAFPNPFNSSITIQAKGDFSYTIHAISGKLIEKGVAQNHIAIGNELEVGVYLLNINSANGNTVHKIIKQ